MKNGKYELIVPPADYPGKKYRGKYAYEHHVVWWQVTGEAVEKGYTIHHRNGHKRDNRFSNLEKLTKEEHDKHHSHDKPKTMIYLVCSFCEASFEREARQVRTKQKMGQTDFYCKRECLYRSHECSK